MNRAGPGWTCGSRCAAAPKELDQEVVSARYVARRPAIAEACSHHRSVRAVPDPGLLDLHYGEWQWKTHDEVKLRWPERYASWHATPHLVRFPSGESLQDIILRTADVFRRVVEAFPKETVVLVGHDSVNRAMLLQLLDQPLSAYWKLAQDPCCINVVEHAGGVVRRHQRHAAYGATGRQPERSEPHGRTRCRLTGSVAFDVIH